MVMENYGGKLPGGYPHFILMNKTIGIDKAIGAAES
jgi:hypothetical protein